MTNYFKNTSLTHFKKKTHNIRSDKEEDEILYVSYKELYQNLRLNKNIIW